MTRSTTCRNLLDSDRVPGTVVDGTIHPRRPKVSTREGRPTVVRRDVRVRLTPSGTSGRRARRTAGEEEPTLASQGP